MQQTLTAKMQIVPQPSDGQLLLDAMKEVPIWEKSNLTLEEAAAYSGIGVNKLRELTNERECKFVLWNGNKRLIKRKELDKFTESSFSI